jgi:hypothetical protein
MYRGIKPLLQFLHRIPVDGGGSCASRQPERQVELSQHVADDFLHALLAGNGQAVNVGPAEADRILPA